MTAKIKQCPQCKRKLSAGEFHKDKMRKGGLSWECKECTRLRCRTYYASGGGAKKSREYFQKNRGVIERKTAVYRKTESYRKARRKSHFKGLYGITLEQHKQMYLEQNGCCALCDKSVAYDKIHTDHDHKINKVRGLLCLQCNTGLGAFGDTYEGIMRAAGYLRRNR